MSDPKLWKRTDGRFTEVHTPFTTRAKELMDLYNGLKLPFLSIDERLDVLLHTKWTVKEFDCNLTREIVDLIDREADMEFTENNSRLTKEVWRMPVDLTDDGSLALVIEKGLQKACIAG